MAAVDCCCFLFMISIFSSYLILIFPKSFFSLTNEYIYITTHYLLSWGQWLMKEIASKMYYLIFCESCFFFDYFLWHCLCLKEFLKENMFRSEKKSFNLFFFKKNDKYCERNIKSIDVFKDLFLNYDPSYKSLNGIIIY